MTLTREEPACRPAPHCHSVALKTVAAAPTIRAPHLRLVVPEAAPSTPAMPAWSKTDPMPWRRARLALIKQTAEYQSLTPILKKVVNYVSARESEDQGFFLSQTKLAAKFDVSLRTMGSYLREIVRAGVLTCEHRAKKGCGRVGRTTNVYRLNDALLSVALTDSQAVADKIADSSADRSTTDVVRVEAPTEHSEAATQRARGLPSSTQDVKDDWSGLTTSTPIPAPHITSYTSHESYKTQVELDLGQSITGAGREIVYRALLENPHGVLRCAARARYGDSPVGLLVHMLRAGEHRLACLGCGEERPDVRDRLDEFGRRYGRGDSTMTAICDPCAQIAVAATEALVRQDAERVREERLPERLPAW